MIIGIILFLNFSTSKEATRKLHELPREDTDNSNKAERRVNPGAITGCGSGDSTCYNLLRLTHRMLPR